MLRTTKHQTKYWKERKIDWKQAYQSTVDHPHRKLISAMLRSIPFVSLWEVGVGGGANLIRVIKDMPNKQLGGSDVSEEAVALCKETFKNGLFHVESGDNLMMSDKSVDVILSDMCLIYVDPLKIDDYLREFKRVTRNYVVICEFHSKSWWKRQWARLQGYHVYDYQRRMEKLGYFNIQVQHIPEELWPGTDKNTEFRSLITARV
jgi:ubiquinone/menaquinone biosynthesis C-methylase UbiE